MGKNKAGSLGLSVILFQQWSDDRLFAAVWQLHLFKRRTAHADIDWSQNVSDVLDQPGWRCIKRALFWIRIVHACTYHGDRSTYVGFNFQTTKVTFR